MAEISFRVRPLPEDVCAQLLSSLEINSPYRVVEGLFRNALDAGARSITIEVDFARGYIRICDDGCGICGVEFSTEGHLAESGSTSRSNSPHPTYGRYGRFLSNLSFLCLLSISSLCENEPQANRLVLQRGQVVSRQLGLPKEDAGFLDRGTRIVVHGLFGNLPVRSKQMFLHYSTAANRSKSFDDLKKDLIGYLLAQAVQVDVRLFSSDRRHESFLGTSGPSTDESILLQPVVSLLRQAKLVSSLDTAKWRQASICTKHFSIHAAISLEPCPSKYSQFVSFGRFPVRRGEVFGQVFELIDRLFEESSFGITNNMSNMRTAQQRRVTVTEKPKRAIDRWPAFYLRIQGRTADFPVSPSLDELSSAANPTCHHLMKTVESLIHHFLESHGFCSRDARSSNARSLGIAIERAPVVHQTPALSHPASETLHLNHWRRVRSGHSERDGLGATLRLNADEEDEAFDGDILLDVTDSARLAHRLPTREQAAKQLSNADDASPVWTSPHHSQHFQLRPLRAAHGPRIDLLPSGPDWRSPMISRTDADDPQPRDDLPSRPGTTLANCVQNPALYRLNSSHRTFTLEAEADPEARSRNSVCVGGLLDESQPVTKSSLAHARVVQQLDQKFVLAVVDAPREQTAQAGESKLLVVVDQHAADERIKFEQLCREFCQRSSTSLVKPMVFEVDDSEIELFERRKEIFHRWGVTYRINLHTRLVEVTQLPPLLTERCRAEPKLLFDLMRREIWSDSPKVHAERTTNSEKVPCYNEDHWLSGMAHCPVGMVDLLKSRACRTAIMFNDHLDIGQSRRLLRNLSQCALPFQCAHGRPTLTVLTDISKLGRPVGTGRSVTDCRGAEMGFGRAWKLWAHAN